MPQLSCFQARSRRLFGRQRSAGQTLCLHLLIGASDGRNDGLCVRNVIDPPTALAGRHAWACVSGNKSGS